MVSMNRNEEGLIQFGNTVLTEASSNILEPKILKGDLILTDTKKKDLKEKDIITYFTKKNNNLEISTNEIAAITKDVNGITIYSLKKRRWNHRKY